MVSGMQFQCPVCGVILTLSPANVVIKEFTEDHHMSVVEVSCPCGGQYEMYRLVKYISLLRGIGCPHFALSKPDSKQREKFFGIVTKDDTDDLTPEQEQELCYWQAEVEALDEIA